MQIKDLEAFQNVPFLCWVKDEDWRYLWGNRAICDLAGENVAGKKDSELVWKANADPAIFAGSRPSSVSSFSLLSPIPPISARRTPSRWSLLRHLYAT